VSPSQAEVADCQIAYLGPTLRDGRMDLRILSDALGGFAALTERSSQLLYGQMYEHTAELASPLETGSVVIPIQIVSHGLRAAEQFLLSPAVQALANLTSLLGFGASPIAIGLFRVFKEKKGRAIDPATDISVLRVIDIDIEITRYIKLYNDNDVRTSIRRTLRPLREQGIEEFQTRRYGIVIESVTKADLIAADEAQMDEIVGSEEKWLDIQKVALVRHLAWHFAGDGATFDAKIEDEKLWKRVEGGERFGFGDRLRVVLRTAATRDRNGRLHVEYLITEVLDVEHHHHTSQPGFWADDPRISDKN
jgi:hypothetical protein